MHLSRSYMQVVRRSWILKWGSHDPPCPSIRRHKQSTSPAGIILSAKGKAGLHKMTAAWLKWEFTWVICMGIHTCRFLWRCWSWVLLPQLKFKDAEELSNDAICDFCKDSDSLLPCFYLTHSFLLILSFYSWIIQQVVIDHATSHLFLSQCAVTFIKKNMKSCSYWFW